MKPTKYRPTHVNYERGYWARYEFPNGYSGEVYCNDVSYGNKQGLFEIRVLRGYEVVCDTPITGDALGWVEHGEVEGILDAIAALPKYHVEES